MERMQPPPNYYGMPYPNQMDQNTPPPYQVPPQKVPMPQADSQEYYREEEQPSEGYFTKALTGMIGKKVSVYCSFTDAADWHDKVFSGILTSSGDDYIILDEEAIGKEILILSVYIHFIEFEDRKK